MRVGENILFHGVLHPARSILSLGTKHCENGLCSGIRKPFSFTLAKAPPVLGLVHTQLMRIPCSPGKDVLLSLLGARPVSCVLQALGVRVGAKVAPQRPCSWGRKSVGRPPLLWFAAFFPHFGRGTNENAVLGSSGKRGASLVAHTVDNLPAMYETHV